MESAAVTAMRALAGLRPITVRRYCYITDVFSKYYFMILFSSRAQAVLYLFQHFIQLDVFYELKKLQCFKVTFFLNCIY